MSTHTSSDRSSASENLGFFYRAPQNSSSLCPASGQRHGHVCRRWLQWHPTPGNTVCIRFLSPLWKVSTKVVADLTVLEVRSPKDLTGLQSRCRQAWFFLRLERGGKTFPSSSSFSRCGTPDSRPFPTCGGQVFLTPPSSADKDPVLCLGCRDRANN